MSTIVATGAVFIDNLTINNPCRLRFNHPCRFCSTITSYHAGKQVINWNNEIQTFYYILTLLIVDANELSIK